MNSLLKKIEPSPSPFLSALAPESWLPRCGAAREAFALGQEFLAHTPAVFCFGYETPGWAASEAKVKDARAAWVGPASALWRLSDQSDWRSFCCQALSLGPDQIRSALRGMLSERVAYYGFFAKEWERILGRSLSRSEWLGDRYSPGFACAVEWGVRPEAEARPERLRDDLMSAADAFAKWIGAGWVEWAPRSGGCIQHTYDRNPCELALESKERCSSVWEAAQLELAAGLAAPAPARPRPRV